MHNLSNTPANWFIQVWRWWTHTVMLFINKKLYFREDILINVDNRLILVTTESTKTQNLEIKIDNRKSIYEGHIWCDATNAGRSCDNDNMDDLNLIYTSALTDHCIPWRIPYTVVNIYTSTLCLCCSVITLPKH